VSISARQTILEASDRRGLAIAEHEHMAIARAGVGKGPFQCRVKAERDRHRSVIDVPYDGFGQQRRPAYGVSDIEDEVERILCQGFDRSFEAKTAYRFVGPHHGELRGPRKAMLAHRVFSAIDHDRISWSLAYDRKQKGCVTAPPRRVSVPKKIGSAAVLKSKELGAAGDNLYADMIVLQNRHRVRSCWPVSGNGWRLWAVDGYRLGSNVV
jgi:hypothetical protein